MKITGENNKVVTLARTPHEDDEAETVEEAEEGIETSESVDDSAESVSGEEAVQE